MDEKPRVLVVEDDPDVLRFLEIALSARYELTLAATAEEAWELMQTAGTKWPVPDAVFSDIRMPGGSMDGLELARRIRNEDGPAPPPVVVATGFSRYTEQDAEAAGATALVFKPFSLEAVENLLDRVIRRHRAALNTQS